MEISVYSLGSGSKGNCFVLSDGKTNIMIDAGLSPRATIDKLTEIGLRLSDLNGVLLTHEHNDHVKSIPFLSTYLNVYSHEKTLLSVGHLDGVNPNSLVGIEQGFYIGEMYVKPFLVSHDAVSCYGYTVQNDKEKVSYLTDTGYISKGIMKEIVGCDTLIIESNHDKELLLRGVYPERLKKRILSDKGHLCNEETALAVADLAKNGVKNVMLAHISENNNLGELAYWATVKSLSKIGADKDVAVKVATQKGTVIL